MEFSFIAFESVVTVSIIVAQSIFFYKTKLHLSQFKEELTDVELDEQFIAKKEIGNQVVEEIIDSVKFSNAMSKIAGSINKYILKNHGAADFAIIKNIVDRNIHSREQEVAATISLPLYIGLMGTFLGVIIGLVKIAFFGGVNDDNINAFLGGIFIAMVASLVGLGLTVWNNAISYKEAKKESDKRRNQFFDFLQIYLLPHLGNSLHTALDKLKENIGDFNDKFGKNVQLFDSNFNNNIQHLKKSVESIAGNIMPIIENTKTQKEFLAKLEGVGYKRITQSNIEVFTLMNKAVPNFTLFIEKQEKLNLSIEKTAEFVHAIEAIMNRVKSFEESINKLGDRIHDTDYLQSDLLRKVNLKLSHLDAQFELLKQHSQKSSEEINDFFKREYSEVTALTSNIRREVERALDFNIDNNPLQKLMLLDKLNELDKLQALDKLAYLEKLEQLEQTSQESSLRVDDIAQNLSVSKDNLQALSEQIAVITTDSNASNSKIANDISASKEILEDIKEQLVIFEGNLQAPVANNKNNEVKSTSFLHKIFGKNGKPRD